MPFEKKVIDVSVYQGDIVWSSVVLDDIYAAVVRAGYGRYIKQKDVKFEQNYEGATAVNLPVGVYWFSYAETPAEAVEEAKVCLQILNGRDLGMPVYFDQEENDIPAANRTACAVAFMDYIKANSNYMVGYYTYTSYFSSVDIPTIQAHCDTIWLADYRSNYDKKIPRDMHQYSSSGTVSGIKGRVDMNNLFRDIPSEIKGGSKPMEFVNVSNKAVQVNSDPDIKASCETFSAMDVNTSNGKLEKGGIYPIATMAVEDSVITGSTKGRWCTLTDGRFVAVISPVSSIVDYYDQDEGVDLNPGDFVVKGLSEAKAMMVKGYVLDNGGEIYE